MIPRGVLKGNGWIARRYDILQKVGQSYKKKEKKNEGCIYPSWGRKSSKGTNMKLKVSPGGKKIGIFIDFPLNDVE